MTTAEFNTWLRRHQALFPKLADWFATQPDARVVLDAWSKAMATCDVRHATDATDRMLRGIGPLVEFNDWSTLPAVVIQHCRPLGSGKAERTGDGNYVSGSAVAALKKTLAGPPPAKDAEMFGQFQTMVDVMQKDDYAFTKKQILDALDGDKIGAGSAYRLLRMATEKLATASASAPGNVGDAWEGSERF